VLEKAAPYKTKAVVSTQLFRAGKKIPALKKSSKLEF
jgi:hypothetical protein